MLFRQNTKKQKVLVASRKVHLYCPKGLTVGGRQSRLPPVLLLSVAKGKIKGMLATDEHGQRRRIPCLSQGPTEIAENRE